MLIAFHMLYHGFRTVCQRGAKEKKSESLEAISLEEGNQRVKFKSVWKGHIDDVCGDADDKMLYYQLAKDLGDILRSMEVSNAAPVLPDGKIGGNASVRIILSNKEYLLVSKSGKYAGQKLDLETDFCLLESFDSREWKVLYFSSSDNILPTSDSPLHYAAMEAHNKFEWSKKPEIILHGHALATEEEAATAGLPCSAEETLFSTREDTEALIRLMEDHPYPQYKIYIRKAHGFVLLASDMKEATDTFQKHIVPYM